MRVPAATANMIMKSEIMDKLTERSYQIDAMGDLGDAARKISNEEYESAVPLITEALETTKSLCLQSK